MTIIPKYFKLWQVALIEKVRVTMKINERNKMLFCHLDCLRLGCQGMLAAGEHGAVAIESLDRNSKLAI